MVKNRFAPACTVLLCAVIAAVVVHARPRPQTGTGQDQLKRFVSPPLPGRAAGDDPASFYKPDTLFQLIDGGADVYLLYDFQVMLHQNLKSGPSEIAVDIYDMGNPENAFGIYAAERSPSYKFFAIGAEGYRSKGILNFVQDHYYVKLAGSGANTDLLLDQFANTLSQRIGGSRTLPSLLRQLPLENRVAHSEQYVRKDPLGHAFLAPAYVASYAWGRQQSKLLISVAKDAADAKSRFDQLTKHFKQSGECTPAPEAGADAIQARNSFEGRAIARTQGRYLIFLLNPQQDAAQFVKNVAQNLH
jgi:hypothetical protein